MHAQELPARKACAKNFKRPVHFVALNFFVILLSLLRLSQNDTETCISPGLLQQKIAQDCLAQNHALRKKFSAQGGCARGKKKRALHTISESAQNEDFLRCRKNTCVIRAKKHDFPRGGPIKGRHAGCRPTTYYWTLRATTLCDPLYIIFVFLR
jgi:hypothetical protein